MRAKDLVVGEYYQKRGDRTPSWWVKVIEILGPGEKENVHKRIMVKCEFTDSKNAMLGTIRYFRPSEIIKRD